MGKRRNGFSTENVKRAAASALVKDGPSSGKPKIGARSLGRRLARERTNGRRANQGEEEDELQGDDAERQFQKLLDEARTAKLVEKKSRKAKKGVAGEEDAADADEDAVDDEELAEERRVLEEIRTNRVVVAKPTVNDTVALSALAEDVLDKSIASDFEETLMVLDAQDMPALDAEDDIKREIEFVSSALRAVHAGRAKLDEMKVPHIRPNDYLATMVKSDDHMSRVKRRLLLEQQKIAAVEERKASVHYKKRAKEVQAKKTAEKSEKKKAVAQMAGVYRSIASSRAESHHADGDDEFGRGGAVGEKRRKIGGGGFDGKKSGASRGGKQSRGGPRRGGKR